MGQTNIIEQQQPLSHSQLWSGQRAFYDKKGVDAWAGDVPFYITSNLYIASCYAELVIRFIQDCINNKTYNKKEPFYVLELGTGTGQFSFYALRRIIELQQQLELTHVTIRYVITDFTENNLKFWHEHRALRPFVEAKQLDFAIYDLENDVEITLTDSGETWRKGSLKNPLIVFANYIFDSIKSDIFAIKNGEIKESLVTLKSNQTGNLDDDNFDWEKIDIKFSERNINSHYYNDSDIDTILCHYQNQFEDTQLLFPIGSLKCIKNLSEIANGKLLLLSSDKGFSTTEELADLDYPELDFHGSFSLMVNFHAIANYFTNHNGDSFMQTPRDGLTSAAFTAGIKFDQLPETKRMLIDTIEGFSPSDYFTFYEHIEKTHDKAALPVLLSFLCFSNWDPYIYYLIHAELIEHLEDASDELVHYILKNIKRVANNFYYVPECDDVFFAIGLLLYELDQYEEALEFYDLSQEHFESSFETIYNIGLCYFYAENYQQAYDILTKALAMNPRAKHIKDIIRKAERRL